MSTNGNATTRDRSQTDIVLILNGDSSRAWDGAQFKFPLVGCNYLYRDYKLTHCVAIDRMTVAHMRDDADANCSYWTKTSPLPLPEGWLEWQPPGIDSGSMALDLVLNLYPLAAIWVIGADGVLELPSTTRYYYSWHPNGPSEHAKTRHRATWRQLIQKHDRDIWFVSDQVNDFFKTRTVKQAKEYLLK